MKIGVITPVYNRPEIVLDAIRCVAAQSHKPDRLVVVDDGSTDTTAANIEACFDTLDPSFECKLVRQQRAGVSAARNRAAKELEDCDLLAMIDSDDLWPDDYLERMSAPFSDANVAASFCDQVFVNTRDGSRRERDLSVYATDTTRRMFLYGPPTPSCTVIRGSLFRKLGGYDQSLTCSEDYDLHLRLSLEGRWAYVPNLNVQIRRATGVEAVTAHHLTEVRDLHIGTQRALMLERFARELGGCKAMPWRAWRAMLERTWQTQGEAYQDAGEASAASWCFRKAWINGIWSPAALARAVVASLRAHPRHPSVTKPHDSMTL